jgi:carbon-monoxide dehydrogenase large subunit
VVNAVIDAIAHLGVTHIEKPATPERVWSALHGTTAQGPPGPARSGTVDAPAAGEGGAA